MELEAKTIVELEADARGQARADKHTFLHGYERSYDSLRSLAGHLADAWITWYKDEWNRYSPHAIFNPMREAVERTVEAHKPLKVRRG